MLDKEKVVINLHTLHMQTSLLLGIPPTLIFSKTILIVSEKCAGPSQPFRVWIVWHRRRNNLRAWPIDSAVSPCSSKHLSSHSQVSMMLQDHAADIDMCLVGEKVSHGTVM